MLIHTYIHVHIHKNLVMYIYIHTHTHTNKQTNTHTHTHVCIDTQACCMTYVLNSGEKPSQCYDNHHIPIVKKYSPYPKCHDIYRYDNHHIHNHHIPKCYDIYHILNVMIITISQLLLKYSPNPRCKVFTISQMF